MGTAARWRGGEGRTRAPSSAALARPVPRAPARRP
nr:MAG TPA: hypothetical protein [Caudoviricetes sp.]